MFSIFGRGQGECPFWASRTYFGIFWGLFWKPKLAWEANFWLWEPILGFGKAILCFGQFWALAANFGLWGPILGYGANFGLWEPILTNFGLAEQILGFGDQFWALEAKIGFGK